VLKELILYSCLALGYNGATPENRTFCLAHHVANLLEGKMIGQTVSHYKIVEKLGEGGMGVVYKAEDTKLKRTVALKFLPSELTRDKDTKRRFIREAQAASALQHNNICTIHEIDETPNGRLFICMDFYEGETLKEKIARGPLPVEEAIDMTSQVAAGLSEAQRVGMVHRDVKPANIMVTGQGVAKILDFGLAKLAGQTKVTKTGTTMGTVAYMSPEQARGEETDVRSDIWSLGVVLYELLTDELPFKGDHAAAVMYGIMHTDPEPRLNQRVDVPLGLQKVVSKCLEKNAGNRYRNAADLRVAIEECLERESVEDRPSIAVFPFTNMSGSKEDDYLCEGLAEEIISAITQIPGLRVIARTSAFAVGRMELDIREAGKRLDVRTILEGSVRRVGSRVRVAAQLVSTSDNAQLWCERYDRELKDVLALEDEIAEAIATRLRVDLASNEGERTRPAIDVEAHTAYLEGRYFFARGTPESIAKAKRCYERAIGRNPDFALVYDSLAELYWYLGFFGGVAPRDAFSLSTWHALRALELDDSLAETHALLGMLRKELDYNWPEVDRELRRAIELNRDSPLVRLRYAISGPLPRGRIDEAMTEIEGVLRSDPMSIFIRWWAAAVAYLARQPARMVEEGRRINELDPSNFLGHWALGMGLEGNGMLTEAVVAMEKAHELSGGIPFTLGFLALVHGRAGRRDDAKRLLKQAGQLAATGYVPPSVFMLGHAGLNDWDAALDGLGRAIEARDPFAMPIKTFPFLDPVRTDPRYQILLKKMNLE
jgi:TolB-like protein/tRNA A-37 threonylcarbamoyl transferase component Bud32